MAYRCPLLLALVFLAGPWPCAGQTEAPLVRAPRLLATETLAPLSPSLTTLAARLPWSVFPLPPPLQRLEAETWLLADSPYAWPRSYLELGAVLGYALLDRPRSRIVAGVGTALGLETREESVSVPLLLRVQWRWAPLPWLLLEAGTEGLLYGEGGGASARLAVLFRPFAAGVLVGLGVGYGLLSTWDANPWGQSLQLDLHAGYAWAGRAESAR